MADRMTMVEVVARAICPEGFDWLDDLTANTPRDIDHGDGEISLAADDSRLFDAWPARIDLARTRARAALLAQAEAELSIDVGIAGIEVSLLGRPWIDNDVYVLSIFRAICRAAAEEGAT